MSIKEVYFRPRNTKIRRGQAAQQRVAREPLIEGGVYKLVNGSLELVKEPPKAKPKQPLQVRAGLYYRSLDGRKAQVFYINKSSEEFPVVGAIETEGVWKPMVWNIEGITKRPYGAVNDLIAVWSQT